MAKVIQVTQYEANDGSLFLSAAEADAHDFKLENGEKIRIMTEAFLNTTGAIDRSRNMQANVIEAFLAFTLPRLAEGTEMQEVERTVFDTPKPEKVVSEGAADAAADAVEPAKAEGEDGEAAPAPLF